MEIKLPIKIHNKFEIEVKDISTGDIVQRGYAENIVLDNFFNSVGFMNHVGTNHIGSSLCFGSGTGILSVSRTTLFNYVGYKGRVLYELVANQAPLESYATCKSVFGALENVGLILTEVGLSIGALPTIYTHALIKDSEGNLLSLGPKTDTQEITIYSTVYFQPNFEPGINILNVSASNGLIVGATLSGHSQVTYNSTTDAVKPIMYVNGTVGLTPYCILQYINNGIMNWPEMVLDTTIANGKIKTLEISRAALATSIKVDLEVLAQNNSTIWGGWEFDRTSVGVGNGVTQVFNLLWDEARLDKAKVVYVDGVVDESAVWTESTITFNIAPTDQAIITADYWVDYMPKDLNHISKINLQLSFSEGVAS